MLEFKVVHLTNDHAACSCPLSQVWTMSSITIPGHEVRILGPLHAGYETVLTPDALR
jgi:hypothetical protein